MKLRGFALCLGLLPLFALAGAGGCSVDADETQVSAGERTGSANLAVTNIPSDVSCLRITAVGGTTVVTLVDVTPGQPADISLSGQPIGTVAFTADAFPSICAVVTGGTTPNWLSDTVVVSLSAGVPVDISLTLHENGITNVGVDFSSGLTCHDADEPCLTDSDCCSGVCYATQVCAGACSANGATCASASECCGGQCSGSVCCVPDGNACTTGADCCSTACVNGACLAQASPADVCGDGVLGSSEACDDGNVNVGDGCSNCTVDPGFSCAGEPSACAPSSSCNDAMQNGAESDVDCGGPACAPCALGQSCTTALDCASSACVAGLCMNVAVCGDGMVSPGEACDDGNGSSGDGCSSQCVPESGYLCFGAPSFCSGICGDGVVVSGEVCDDGNAFSGDGCTGFCTVEPGWSCAGQPSVCSAAQPNGNVCVTNAQCMSGSCVDGVCCNTGCSGLCQACSTAKTGAANGTCALVAAFTDPDNECSGAQTCGPMGTCF
jgi:cysteine-rich repeat protein